MRLFIAIRLNDEIRKTLVKKQDDLSRHGICGKITPRENLHMTLAFIGEHPDPEQVLEVMENVPFSSFPVTLNGIGLFNNNILWAGVHASEPLQQLVQHLRYELAKADIPYDRKDFMPHITLFRKVDHSKAIPETPVMNVSMLVDSISLFRSDQGKSGMIYTELGSIRSTDSIF